MKDQTELKEYFETLAQKPYLKQRQTKALITRGLEANEKSSLVRELVGKDRGVTIEMETDFGDDTVMVVKSTEFEKSGLCYAVDFVDLKTKTSKKSDEYFSTKEEAIMAAMIVRSGGNDTVIAAVHLMIKGRNKE
jgi:hypothetical protein